MAPRSFTTNSRSLGLLSALLGFRLATLGAEPFRLGNDCLHIGISPEHGGLVELVDSTVGHNHLVTGPEAAGMWELEVACGTEVRTLSPAQARVFRCEPVGRDPERPERGATALRAHPGAGPGAPALAGLGAGQTLAHPGNIPALKPAKAGAPGPMPGVLRLCWEGFDLPAAPRFRVEVEARVDQALPLSRWNIRVANCGGLTLRSVRFPRLAHLAPQPIETLAVPVWLGQQTAQVRQLLSGTNGHGKRLEWSYPGELSLQCLALYAQPGSGLYVACDDTAAFGKAFACFGDGHGNIGCELVHRPENRGASGGDWSLPYRVLLGTFQGDWFTAAERYRAWATDQAGPGTAGWRPASCRSGCGKRDCGCGTAADQARCWLLRWRWNRIRGCR